MDYVDRFITWQESPLEFVFDMWGLTPQPVIDEHFDACQDAIDRGAWDEFKIDWFVPMGRQEIYDGKHITWQQWLIFLAVERAIHKLGPPRITVASGHGTGKDATLAMLILWYLFCHKDAQVPCTAPSTEQMYDVLWKELAKWLKRMPQPVQDLYEYQASYLRMRESPETWFARAKTARKESPEALAGVHGDFVFMAVDEASGVAEEIYNTAEGALTNDNIIVFLISNPTRIIGYFYDSHHEKCSKCAARMSHAGGVAHWKGGDANCEHLVVEAASWQRIQLDSEQSPIVRPGFAEGIIAKHGKDSDEYKIRVKGLFADEDSVDEQGYVPLLNREDVKEVPDVGGWRPKWTRLGIDPAGEGKNETIFVLRDKFRAKIVAVEKISDGVSIARKAIALMELYSIPDWQVTVDAFGTGIDAVQELAIAGFKVYAVNTGDPCEDAEEHARFINIRAASGWALRTWLKKGNELIRNKRWAQIIVIRYRRQLSGKLKIMDKLEMRRRGIPSPDAYDALALTFCRPEGFEKREANSSDDGDGNAGSVYNH